MSAVNSDQGEPPDDAYVHQRFIPIHTVGWVKQCDQIMVEYGMVSGSTVYRDKHQARHRARRLIRLMVELRLHERHQLVEHTGKRDGGFIWTVEYIRRHDGRAEDTSTDR